MKFSFVIMGFLLFFFACKSDKNIPSNIINPNLMADILVDIAIAEGFSESFLFKDSLSKKDSVLKKEISKVLQTHSIKQQQFSKSYQYYAFRPNLYKVVMDSANARIIRGKEIEFTNDSLQVK
jgi:Fe-S cluster assembly iron-binding protein IscA